MTLRVSEKVSLLERLLGRVRNRAQQAPSTFARPETPVEADAKAADWPAEAETLVRHDDALMAASLPSNAPAPPSSLPNDSADNASLADPASPFTHVSLDAAVSTPAVAIDFSEQALSLRNAASVPDSYSVDVVSKEHAPAPERRAAEALGETFAASPVEATSVVDDARVSALDDEDPPASSSRHRAERSGALARRDIEAPPASGPVVLDRDDFPILGDGPSSELSGVVRRPTSSAPPAESSQSLATDEAFDAGFFDDPVATPIALAEAPHATSFDERDVVVPASLPTLPERPDDAISIPIPFPIPGSSAWSQPPPPSGSGANVATPSAPPSRQPNTSSGGASLSMAPLSIEQSPSHTFSTGAHPESFAPSVAASLSFVVEPPPPSLDVAPPRPPPPPVAIAIATEIEADVMRRNATNSEPIARFVAATRRPLPVTFGELLDEALSLGE